MDIKSLLTHSWIGLDLETYDTYPPREKENFNWFTSEIRLVQLSYMDEVDKRVKCLIIDLFQERSPQLLTDLKELLESPNVVKLVFNAKFEYTMLKKCLGIQLKNIKDLYIVFTVYHNGEYPKHKGNFTLKHAATIYTNLDVDKTEQKSDWSKPILTQSQLEYAAQDVLCLPVIAKNLFPLVPSSLGPTIDLEHKLIPIVGDMELRGVHVDFDLLRTKEKELTPTMDSLKEEVEKTLGISNMRSWQQLLKGFRHLGLDIQSTDKYVLAESAKLHPVIPKILKFKELDGVRKFAVSLPKRRDPDGRLRSHFNSLGTDTGRFSSSQVNLQNINKEFIRTAFVAPPGKKLVVADYSQLELVIAAEVTQDARMVSAYRNGEDLHRLTASFMTGKPLDQITKEERQKAKGANFGYCLLGDTEVVTSLGLKPIKDIRIGERVLTHKGNWKLVTDTQKIKADKVYRITTRSGLSATSTGDHMWRVVIPSANGRPCKEAWVETRELVVGDYLKPNNFDYVHTDNDHIGVDRCRMLGYCLSEGCRGKYSFKISQSPTANPDVFQAMTDNLVPLGFYKRPRVNEDMVDFCLPANIRTDVLSGIEIDWSAKARTKTFSNLVTKLSRAEKLALLAGLWDGDGHISTQGANRLNCQYTSVSGKLLTDIQCLLASLGIVSKIYIYPNTAGVLHITGSASKARFIDLVPTVKVERVEYKPKKSFNAEAVIVSIEELEHNDWVYDITVDTDHSFIANGLVSHNCFGMGCNNFITYARDSYNIVFSEEEARNIREAYFTAYPGIRRWHQRCSEQCADPAFTELHLLSGRRRKFNDKIVGCEKRFTKIANTQIQGVGGDIIKRAMVFLAEYPEIEMLIQVHDELVCEVPESRAEELCEVVKQCMIKGGEYYIRTVPITVEAHVVDSWAEK